ncbi:kinase-like domain-containing protein [Hyaloscypha sp. PMI_1271]|nr:kinase-like domain-containing protein [Hyaloscypha sp. PMI_1271]
MAPLEPAEEDAIPMQLLQQLSRTAYVCSSLSSPLSSRPGNLVYRGILAQPIRTPDGATVQSIIIKHSTDSVPKIFEELLLHALASYLPPATTATVKPPRLYLTATIGRHLGFWLRSFHVWSSAPEQAALRAQMWQNDPMRKTKYLFTYDSVLKVLENYPELMDGHEKTLDTIRDVIAKEFERPSTEDGDGYGLLHGDFWSGNAGWREPPLADKTNELFIIDWEFAQFGHRSCDLGQIVGDLYERKTYGNLDTAIFTMEGVIDGYGALSDEMAFRTAIYVGVHLISWYNRQPRKGPKVAPPEVIVAGLTAGRDFMVKGWEKDRAFFQGSALGSLFAAR